MKGPVRRNDGHGNDIRMSERHHVLVHSFMSAIGFDSNCTSFMSANEFCN